jgi:hypothetical protein
MPILDGQTIGLVTPGPVVNIAAIGTANAVIIFALPTSPSLLGTFSATLQKVRWKNNGTGASTVLHIGTGTGGGFVDLIPAIDTINNLDDEITLPPVESFAAITAYVDVVGASSVDVQLTVSEKA